jgi:hypothetical protein
MKTSTKWVIGGVAAASVLWLFRPKVTLAMPGKLAPIALPPPPPPMFALAGQPGALLLQPDPNSLSLVQVGGNWGLNATGVLTLNGKSFMTGNSQTYVLHDSAGNPYPITQPVPKDAILALLASNYAAALPTNITLSNPPFDASKAPQGGFWRASYDLTVANTDGQGGVKTRNLSHDVDLQAYPSGGPQPPLSVVNDAVYHDMLGAM